MKTKTRRAVPATKKQPGPKVGKLVNHLEYEPPQPPKASGRKIESHHDYIPPAPADPGV